MYPCRALATVPAILIVSTPLLHAQSDIVLPREVSCPECRIELERVVTLGSLSDPTGFSGLSRVTQDSRGRYYVYPSVGEAEILVYDEAGQFLRLVGRPGPGPREFGRIERVVVADGDTLHVYHGLRHTVLDPEYEFVRSGPMPAPPNAVLLLDAGRSVIVGELLTRQSVGLPLHLLDSNDSLLLSFGSLHPERDPRRSRPAAYRLARSEEGHLWLAGFHRYAFERWTLDGEREVGFTRDVAWFPEWEAPNYSTTQPRTVWIHEDPAGRVWLGIAIPTIGPTRPPAVHRERPYDPMATLARFSMRVDVIDVAASTVVLSQRLSDVVMGFIAPNRVYSLREDISGNPVFDIWRVQLQTR
jgi:hypothetical protein